VEPGSRVTAFSENDAMARVASLYDPARLQVRVDVPLADAAKIGREQSALVTSEILPDMAFDHEQIFETAIDKIKQELLYIPSSRGYLQETFDPGNLFTLKSYLEID